MDKILSLCVAAAISTPAAMAFSDVPPQSPSRTENAEGAKLRYQESRKHLEENRFDAAAAGFRELALKHSDMDIGALSVPLYFEAISKQITSSAEAPLNEASGTAAELHDIYCVQRKGSADKELCGKITRIHCDLVRLSAEKLIKKSDQGGKDQRDNAGAAGDLYFSLVRLYGGTEEQLRGASCGRMDEILYNAGTSYRSAGRAFEGLKAFQLLADSKKAFPGSALVSKAAYEAGNISLTLGEFADAAGHFERYAKESPADQRASEALSDALILRLGLSEGDRAEEDAALFQKLFGAKQAARSANISLALGMHHIERSNFQSAERQLSKSISLIDKSGTLTVALQAHAALGRAYSELKKETDADKQYQFILSAFRDPFQAVKRITSQEPGSSDRQLGKALTALGEAHFYFAEKERAKANGEKLPLPKGGKSALSTYPRDLQPVLLRRRAAIENAEKAYLKVLDIQPMPPPKWVVASGSRVADMWADLAAELKSIGLAMKKEFKPDEGKAVYEQFIDASMPWFERAKRASKTCLDYSVKFAHFSEYSKRCEAWLTANVPKEVPPITELLPRFQLSTTPFLIPNKPFAPPEGPPTSASGSSP